MCEVDRKLLPISIKCGSNVLIYPFLIRVVPSPLFPNRICPAELRRRTPPLSRLCRRLLMALLAEHRQRVFAG